MKGFFIACLLALLSGACVPFLSRSAPPPPQSAMQPDSAGREAVAYRELIPDTAVTDSGLFVTHRVEEKLYYEVPPELLGTEMLLVTTIARNAEGEFGGQPVDDRLVRWERHGDRILLRSRRYELRADSADPVSGAVEAATYASIMASFPIAAWSPDSAAVIEVTRMFNGGVSELGPNAQGTLEKDRTFVERVAAYPENIEVEATHTRTVESDIPGVPEKYQPAPHARSIGLHWSMVKLPDDPMTPRLFDSRVGYFSIGKTDFGTGAHQAERYRYINRWRLECPAGQSLPCEPVKPIVFYVDPATPSQWVPWIERGVEAWQGALERAGFRNAILAKEVPSPREDPAWSAEDARYSVVRWMASTTENAMGPHVHDPRTGEIIEADIHMYHNSLKLVRDWYFTQVAPLDLRAQRLPFPDSLMGRLLAYIVTHEVGHALGLQHNFKASSTYPADSLRSERFLRRMGHVPSVMDYARFNYLVQPEDSIAPELLLPRIGPYDEFAIMWGYKPVPGADTPEEIQETLDDWARMQDSVPWYRHNTAARGADAGQLTEAVGDADPVQSTRLGLRNIRRTMPLLIPATVRAGENYDELEELYGKLVLQWQTELGHVVATVGGVDSQEKYGGQEGARFESLPAERQAEAVTFLNQQAFRTPEYLLDQQILRRIAVSGTIDRIGKAQSRILSDLLGDSRMERMVEFETLARPGERVYTLGEMLDDVRQGIWSELSDGRVRVDAFRIRLQNGYLDLLEDKLSPPAEGEESQRRQPSRLIQAMLRGELAALNASLRAALPRACNRMTRDHLRAAGARIERMLHEKE